jgi:transcription elongation factor GreA
MASIQLTPQGAAQLTAELGSLKQRREEVAERIRMEREQAHGDFGDSRTYEDAKSESVLIEGRIVRLESLLADVEVLAANDAPRTEVVLGAQVEACTGDGETESYLIVEPVEANPQQGRISHESPVGRALLGHRPGERVDVETPGGVRELTILSIH